MKRKFFLFVILIIIITHTSFAQRFYVGNGLDFAMLSTSISKKPGGSTDLTVPRFTALVHVGFSFHYDVQEKWGLTSGIGWRNIGFIEKEGELTIKRRVYALGIPLGFKFGDLRNRNFVFAGGGVDIPFHYKEKIFEKRSDKTKYSKWHMGDGGMAAPLMPFVYAGHSWDPGITLKLQYYPLNFMNEDITPNYTVNLLLLSVGIDIHYGQFRIQQREFEKMHQEKSDTNRSVK